MDESVTAPKPSEIINQEMQDMLLATAIRRVAKKLESQQNNGSDSSGEREPWITSTMMKPTEQWTEDEKAYYADILKQKEEARRNWDALMAEKDSWDQSKLDMARDSMRVAPIDGQDYGKQMGNAAIEYALRLQEQINKTPYSEDEKRDLVRSAMVFARAVEQRSKVKFTSEEEGFATQVAVLEAVGRNANGDVDHEIIERLGLNIVANKRDMVNIGRKNPGRLGGLLGGRKGSTNENMHVIEDVAAELIKDGDRQPGELKHAVARIRHASRSRYPGSR